MQFLTAVPETPDVVVSAQAGYYFRCPDVASVDRHISMIRREFLSPTSNATTQRKAKALTDLDHLLDRRLFIEWMAA